jgi:hypothetical protein
MRIRTALILADRQDGKPLGKDGPFRLAVGGDLTPARSWSRSTSCACPSVFGPRPHP